VKKRVFLLLLAGGLILIGCFLLPVVIVLFKVSFEPKPVEISETDFIKLLESHQKFIGSLGVSEMEEDGKFISHSVVGAYTNPNPPGNEIRFETTSVDGPATDVEALIKKHGVDNHSGWPRRRTLASTVIRSAPFALFLLIAWFLFRREVSSMFSRWV
jgi:hypothetical protein